MCCEHAYSNLEFQQKIMRLLTRLLPHIYKLFTDDIFYISSPNLDIQIQEAPGQLRLVVSWFRSWAHFARGYCPEIRLLLPVS